VSKATATDLAFIKSDNPVLELMRQVMVRREIEANRNLVDKPVVNHDYLHALGLE